MKEIFFTSDTHFGTNKALARENRPFRNWKVFYRKTIKQWNKQAKKDDLIYHLGDFIDYVPGRESNWKFCLNLVKNIKAKVVLIIGNNEERLIKDCFNDDFDKFRNYCLNVGFSDVKKEDYIEIEDFHFYLNHKPHNFKKDYITLFGHTHRATGLWKPFGINVGCDLNHFILFDMQELKRLLIDKEKYWDKDIDNLCMGDQSEKTDFQV